MLLGAHMSIAGGLHNAFRDIMSVDGTALQIFTRNQRQWKFPPLKDEDVARFKAAWEEWGDYPVIAHDSYLINLASPKPEQAEKSLNGFAAELQRCETLGIKELVTHPGSHLGQGVEAGLERYTANLDDAIEQSETENVTVLLETTAGQGTNLGSTFDELAKIIELSRFKDRLAVCLDTCHVFCAGYDLRDEDAYHRTFAEFERIIGLDRLKFFHLNDTKNDLASHKDRHEHIGKGFIGVEGFRLLMNDERFKSIPKSLETPKEKDLAEDRMNLELLRSLVD